MDYLQRDDEFFGDFLDTDECVDDEFVFDEGGYDVDGDDDDWYTAMENIVTRS